MKSDVKYRRKKSHNRRLDLIAAGIRCLGEGGLSNFTIDKICKQANVSRGLINHHFKSKDDLLLCIYDSMTLYLVETDETLNPEENVLAVIDKSFNSDSFEKSNLRAWLAVWGEVATHAKLRQLHVTRYRIYRQKISSAIRDIANARRLDIDANAIARQLIALIDGLWLEYCLHSDGFSLEAASKDCYQFLQLNLGAFNDKKK